MNGPRADQRELLARWLRIRADVRALAKRLVAAEYALERDLRRSDDQAEVAQLRARLATERVAVDALAGELDGRIAAVKAQCAQIEARWVDVLVAAARATKSARR